MRQWTNTLQRIEVTRDETCFYPLSGSLVGECTHNVVSFVVISFVHRPAKRVE